MKRSWRVVVFGAFFLAAGLHSPPAVAQQRTAVDALRALPLERLDGKVTVYHSPGYRDRAEELQLAYEEALGFYERLLEQEFEMGLAVLTEEHWNASGWPQPYGMPSFSYRTTPQFVFMPATTDQGIVVENLRRFGEDVAQRRLNLIGFHEVGHVITRQYLYPDANSPPPVFWFDEMLATYIGKGFVWETLSGGLEEGRELFAMYIDGHHPLIRSLQDFEAAYRHGSFAPGDYGWFQSQFGRRGTEVFEARGLAILPMLKERLPWESFTRWTSEELLMWLEEIEPGFQKWASSLGTR